MFFFDGELIRMEEPGRVTKRSWSDGKDSGKKRIQTSSNDGALKNRRVMNVEKK